jgi:hypothetical protein
VILSNPIDNPIFILGTQRSGTTLLCRMLSAHPRLFIQNELNVREIFAPIKSKINILSVIKNLIFNDHGKSLNSILKENNKDIWGLKDPELTGYLSDLKSFFPDSKYVVIVRDARAVTKSYIENKWGLGTNVYTGAQRWVSEVALQYDFYKNNENVYLLRFEDLIFDSKKEIIKLLNFLEIEFDEKVLSFNETPTLYHMTRENKNTFSSINKNIPNKWEETFTKKEIEIIETIADKELLELGYKLKFEKINISSLQKFFYRVHQFIIGEVQIQYRWRTSMIREYFRKKKLGSHQQ